MELWLEGPGDQTICSKDSINTRRIHFELPILSQMWFKCSPYPP